ncbi:hAT family C-terminal dimerization domain containing protein [Nitzschia inconspicua]|uniref:HAT family C-terminal dimerization domain containing protein n=1 Tax=Nitzschia inconspicua TaxID=303405 RepID=A0A9K3KC13_9STRA|nr:hAT family C-terminal dimerization domain containing protein [Nitzschia inconspicua]
MTNLGKVPVYPLSHVKVMAMPALTYLGIPHFNASLVPESSVVLSVNTLDQLEKSQHKCKSPVWTFFHRVEGAKTGVPDKDLPLKWLENCNNRSFMSCNGCGELVVSASIDSNLWHRPCSETLKTAGGRPRNLPFWAMLKEVPEKWWEEKAPYFPVMSSLAKAYLSIQATSAPSERVFSAASMLIEKRRNRLDPELAGKMLFVAQNWDSHEKHLQDMLLAAAEQQEGREVQGSEPPAVK